MKVRKDDYREILDFLIQKRWEGEEFVAYPYDDLVIGKECLYTFSSSYDAKEFCFEMSTDVEYYSYLSIRSAYRAMSEALKDSTLLIEKDGIVDVSLMVIHQYERLKEEQLNNNQKSEIMNQKNFEYVRDQVKFTGFGEGLENDLKSKIESGDPEFKLRYETKYGNDTVSASLNFSKSKQSDMYFFNSYKVSVQKENAAEPMEQSFYINKGNNITLKEAYNLLEGRAVHKELTAKDGHLYNAWLELDFSEKNATGNYKLKSLHDRYGYDVVAVLEKHPIKELGREEFKENLIKSLRKGNLQAATFLINGTEEKRYIAAEPQYKTIRMFDSNLTPIVIRNSKKENLSENEGASVEKGNKKKEQKSAEDNEPGLPKAAKKRKRKITI